MVEQQIAIENGLFIIYHTLFYYICQWDSFSTWNSEIFLILVMI